MSNLPKVSAVITTHNRKGLLKRAIKSVHEQTYPNIELIVVNDASTDGTDDFLNDKDDINKVIHIKKEDSKGGNYARNLGIKNATGELVAFLDDDDYWLPEKIDLQVKLILKEKAELVHCARKFEIVNGNKTKYENEVILPDSYGNVSRRILYRICTTTSCMMCTKKILYEVGLFDENLKFWQEYELTIRLAQKTKFLAINEPLVVYRVNTADKHRLTNKYYLWRESVKYILIKHSKLYNNLSYAEKCMVRAMIYFDGSERLKNSGHMLKSQWQRNMGRFYTIPFRIKKRMIGVKEND